MNVLDKFLAAFAKQESELKKSTAVHDAVQTKLTKIGALKSDVEALVSVRTQVESNRVNYVAWVNEIRESIAACQAGNADHIAGRRRDDAHSNHGDRQTINTYQLILVNQAIVADEPRILKQFDSTLEGIDADIAKATAEIDTLVS